MNQKATSMTNSDSQSPQAWIGACQVMAQPGKLRFWEGQALQAIAYAIVLARSPEDYKAQLYQSLQHNGLDLIRLGDVEPLLQRFKTRGMAQDLVQLARQATPASPVIFGRFQALEETEAKPSVPSVEEVSENHEIAHEYGSTDNSAADLRSDMDVEGPHNTPPASATPEPPQPQWPLPTLTELDWEAIQQQTTLLQQAAQLHHSAPFALWAIIDGANWPEIQHELEAHDPPHACLYSTLDEENRAMAPWLVKLDPDNPVTERFKEQDQINHSGIVFSSNQPIKALREHFRLFTMLWTPADDKSPIYYRFYDPRVLLDSLHTLDDWKIGRLLQPIEQLYIPLSPLLGLAEHEDIDNSVDLFGEEYTYQGRILAVAPQAELPDGTVNSRKAFKVTEREFERFGELHGVRARKALARKLSVITQNRFSESSYLTASNYAPELGQLYSMTSLNQISMLAICLLELGIDFPKGYPDAKSILSSNKLAWQKRKEIKRWLPGACERRNFLGKESME
ncbi:DUF4123 domain-containing protein [Neptunomonas phycophila]|uniref:DUF4123 domain-containing protein n=1 Tax=Neptunomonas phycophila TaxID=1572645 RepID=A0ABT9EVI4_9GAMM|nr:DUF4123 domain-containing protein [Neptunomonas phycophila]MDP2523070.1 DUF4123 domain-containing protein [Neptunomonas phycophila]